ncbi:Hypothetical predicted protein [Pelobates cultripes]|uniref:Uncharacterized protein n=1 Tax=Pelobates cultripes TaxID=61616 RepID=A0AAD1SQ03_PELCU|nr:Hypothetical predicted protein [Pelobates cultripes]
MPAKRRPFGKTAACQKFMKTQNHANPASDRKQGERKALEMEVRELTARGDFDWIDSRPEQTPEMTVDGSKTAGENARPGKENHEGSRGRPEIATCESLKT